MEEYKTPKYTTDMVKKVMAHSDRKITLILPRLHGRTHFRKLCEKYNLPSL